MVRKISTKFRWYHSQLERQMQMKLIEKSPAQTPYRRKFVFIRHGGTRPRRCAGGEIGGVFNNVGGSGKLLITVTV